MRQNRRGQSEEQTICQNNDNKKKINRNEIHTRTDRLKKKPIVMADVITYTVRFIPFRKTDPYRFFKPAKLEKIGRNINKHTRMLTD